MRRVYVSPQMFSTSLLSSLMVFLYGSSRVSFAADARFALALYCDPVCDDAVLDGLEADLALIPAVSGFDDDMQKAGRLMGLLDLVPGRDDDGFGVPDAEYIESYGVDVDRPERLTASQSVVLAWFAGPRSDAQVTLAVAVKAFANAAASSNGWVEDLDTQRVYGKAAWSAMDAAGTLTDWFIVEDNSEAEQDNRLVTRGLRRFGDAELVIAHVAPDAAEDAAQVMNAVANTLHLAPATQSPTGEITVSVQTDLVRGEATLESTSPLAGDPEAPLFAIHFVGQVVAEADIGAPEAPPAPPVAVVTPTTLAEAQAAPTTLAEAQAAMRQRLGAVRTAFVAGLPTGARLAVSVPFNCPDGSREYLWVDVNSWQSTRLSGRVISVPTRTRTVQQGQDVTVDQAAVFDYLLKNEDGTREGNTVAEFARGAPQ